MVEPFGDLLIAVPSAGAVIYVVALFLRFLREERSTRDVHQAATTAVLERLRDSMEELAREVRSTR